MSSCGTCLGRWNWRNFSRLWLRCTVTWRRRSCIVIWRSVWVVTCERAAARWYLTSLIQFTQSWQVTRGVSRMSWFHSLTVWLRSCVICMITVLVRSHRSFHTDAVLQQHATCWPAIYVTGWARSVSTGCKNTFVCLWQRHILAVWTSCLRPRLWRWTFRRHWSNFSQSLLVTCTDPRSHQARRPI